MEELKSRKEKHQKGYSAINVIISVLVLLMSFNLLVEYTILSQRYSHMSQTSSYIARVVAEQGGIRTSVPAGYSNPSKYTQSNVLFNILDSGFREAGFDEWRVTINGSTLTPSRNLSVPEKGELRIRVRAGFRPIFNFRGNSNRVVFVETERTTYSTFTPRNDNLTLIK